MRNRLKTANSETTYKPLLKIDRPTKLDRGSVILYNNLSKNQIIMTKYQFLLFPSSTPNGWRFMSTIWSIRG